MNFFIIKKPHGLKFFVCATYHFTTEELKNVTRLRNVDGYQNISRQQLENKTPSASIPPSIPVSRPSPRSRPRSRSRTAIRTPQPQDQHLDKHLNLFQLIWMGLKKWKWQKPDQYQKIFGISGITV